MRSFSLFVALVAGLASGPALVQKASAQDADGAFYLRAALGGTFVSDQNFDIEYGPGLVPAVLLPTEATIDLGGGFTVGAAVGYDFNFIRTELEYRYAASDTEGLAIDDIGVDVGDGDTLNAHLFFANVFFDLENSSRFTPFVGGGAGGAIVGADENDTVFAYQARAGVAYDFGNGLSGDLEYIYARTEELNFGPLQPFSASLSGDRYEASSVMASIRKQF